MSNEIKDEQIVEEVAEETVAGEKPAETKKKSTKKSAKAEKVEEPVEEPAEEVAEPAKEEAPVVAEEPKAEAPKEVKKVEAIIKSFNTGKAIKLYNRPSVNADYVLFAGSAVVIETVGDFARVSYKTPGQGTKYTGFVKTEDIK